MNNLHNFALNYNILRIFNDYGFSEGIMEEVMADDIKKPTLYLNVVHDCHGRVLCAHRNMLNLDKYYTIVVCKIKPTKLIDGDNEYDGIELNRRIFFDLGHQDVSDEKLERMILNEHRNCTAESCDAKRIEEAEEEESDADEDG